MIRTIVLILVISIIGCQKAREAREHKKQLQAEAIPMYGMLTYMADAASFFDCRTLSRYAVPFKGDWLEVERAYVNMRKNGEPVYVEFRGRLGSETVDGMTKPAVIIEEITQMRPDTTCGEQF